MSSDRDRIPDTLPGRYLPHKRPEDNPGRTNQNTQMTHHSATKHNPTVKSGHKSSKR